jgi:hypothetical protein
MWLFATDLLTMIYEPIHLYLLLTFHTRMHSLSLSSFVYRSLTLTYPNSVSQRSNVEFQRRRPHRRGTLSPRASVPFSLLFFINPLFPLPFFPPCFLLSPPSHLHFLPVSLPFESLSSANVLPCHLALPLRPWRALYFSPWPSPPISHPLPPPNSFSATLARSDAEDSQVHNLSTTHLPTVTFMLLL